MTDDRETLHALKNHLAIVLGFAELLLQEAAEDDARRADLTEIERSARAAMELVHQLGRGTES